MPEAEPHGQHQDDVDEIADRRVQPGAQRGLMQAHPRQLAGRTIEDHETFQDGEAGHDALPTSARHQQSAVKTYEAGQQGHQGRRNRQVHPQQPRQTGGNLLIEDPIDEAHRLELSLTVDGVDGEAARGRVDHPRTPLEARRLQPHDVGIDRRGLRPQLGLNLRDARLHVAVDGSALHVARQPAGQVDAAVVDDDDARVAQSSQLADGPVDDPKPADLQPRPLRLGLGGAQDDRQSRWSPHRGRVRK